MPSVRVPIQLLTPAVKLAASDASNYLSEESMMERHRQHDSDTQADDDLLAIPDSLSPYGQRLEVPLDPEASSALNDVGPGDLLAMMATSSTVPDPEARGEISEHEIAAQLPPETTAIGADGAMDNHRRPIVSINGKDVDEHEHGLDRRAA